MGRAGRKRGLSDPAVLDGKAVAQQIKGTPGITGLSPLSVHSGEEVWHLNNVLQHIGVLRKRFRTNKSAYNGEPVRKNCRFQIADCRLTCKCTFEGRGSLPGNAVGSPRFANLQSKICNLQSP